MKVNVSYVSAQAKLIIRKPIGLSQPILSLNKLSIIISTMFQQLKTQ